MKIYILGFLLLALFSCSEELKRVREPKNLIPKDTMIMALKDLTILESHIKLKYPQVQQFYKTMDKSGAVIFNKYHLDSTRFNASMDYYSSRQAEMQDIYSQILDSVNRELTELSSK
jgi:hypothetical protein